VAGRLPRPESRVCRAERAPLRAEPRPDSEQRDQILFGEPFEVVAEEAGWAFGRAGRDGYVGFVPAANLAPETDPPTHWVRALRTLAFPQPDFKSTPPLLLSMNALVRVVGQEGRYLHADGAGWIVEHHLSPIGTVERDPAEVAERFLGAVYQWGGRESLGLDCSGLVQQALYACGLPCPRDSDMQEALGREVQPDALRRNDLVFWDGHVGLMLDDHRLIHANASHMAVAVEALDEAAARKRAAGEGAPVAYRRLDL
jgi:cell wall-associated NlpC family hydrolase